MGILAPILVLIVSIANIIVGRLIVGKKRRKISDTDGKNMQFLGLLTIAIIGIWCVFVFDIIATNVMKWFWLCFLIITVGFQLFLEWKFLKESKEYLVSLIVLMIGLIYILIFMF